MPHTRPSKANSSPSWTGPVAYLQDPAVRGLGARSALALIRAYKYLFSPWFTGSCRFVPTCADYTAEAIARHGFWRGFWLGARRIGRCHPFGSSGYDPVPSGPVGQVDRVGRGELADRRDLRRDSPPHPACAHRSDLTSPAHPPHLS